jgi:hypothetical protein
VAAAPRLRHHLERALEHVIARPDHCARTDQAFTGEVAVSLIDPDRVYEVASVDLRRVRAVAHRAPADHGAGHRVARDRDVRGMPGHGRTQGVDVAHEVRVELVVGELDEAFHLEALVFVDDEHRQEPSDLGPEERHPARSGGNSRLADPRDSRGGNGAVRIHEGVALGVTFLAEEKDVVSVAPELLGDPGRVDVGAASLEQPPVPLHDPHAREYACDIRPGDRSASIVRRNPSHPAACASH